eukprot:GILJ01008535.1.p1 GENE.GILJ01008535.1~~GILJ01008535.1.p1  ORF type:complete len:917 (+),score=160.70 GILJ01008535.1:233-2983(+)
MLSVSKDVHMQLAEALAIISSADFPSQWQNLLPELISQINLGNLPITIAVLQTMNTIFKRYRYETKSDALFREILYVLGLFQSQLLELFKGLIEAAKVTQDRNTLMQLLQALRLVARIFYSLNAQDLPDFFEEHMAEWMGGFKMFLSYNNRALDNDSDEEPGVVEELKEAIVQCITLYVDKYDEYFAAFLPAFVGDVWQVLQEAPNTQKADSLVTACLRLLTILVSRLQHRNLFQNIEQLQKLVESIVLPSIRIRDSEQELFEDSPVEYVHRDLEGADTESRRRCAMDLLKAMTNAFSEQLRHILSQYVTVLLQEYSSNPVSKWSSKELAIYLVLALAGKGGSQATSAGINDIAGDVPHLVNIVEFFAVHIMPELTQVNIDEKPILKADCLKFVTLFRATLPAEALQALVPELARFLTSPLYVLHSYAAICLERIMTVREPLPGQEFARTGPLRLPVAAVLPYAQMILAQTMQLLESVRGSGVLENEFVMKLLMRLVTVTGDQFQPLAMSTIQSLNTILIRVCANPSNPVFNHYLFETLAALVRAALCNPNVAASVFGQLEQMLFPPFQGILQADVAEFMPYVFQILAMLLDNCPPSPSLSQPFANLLGPVVFPGLWERSGNVPGLTSLVCAYLRKYSGDIVRMGMVQHISTLVGKLMSSRINEPFAFQLAEALFQFLPVESLSSQLGGLITEMLKRLHSHRTGRLVHFYVHAMCVLVCVHGADVFINTTESIQGGLTKMTIDSMWYPTISKFAADYAQLVSKNAEQEEDFKLFVVALTRLTCESQAMLNQPLIQAWPSVLSLIVMLFGTGTPLPPVEGYNSLGHSSMEDEEDFKLGAEPGFQAAHHKLHFASRAAAIPTLANVGDLKTFVQNSLGKVLSVHGQNLIPAIRSIADASVKVCLAREYLPPQFAQALL